MHYTLEDVIENLKSLNAQKLKIQDSIDDMCKDLDFTHLLKAGMKVQAIMKYRKDNRSLTLSEAKDFIDDYIIKNISDYPLFGITVTSK